MRYKELPLLANSTISTVSLNLQYIYVYPDDPVRNEGDFISFLFYYVYKIMLNVIFIFIYLFLDSPEQYPDLEKSAVSAAPCLAFSSPPYTQVTLSLHGNLPLGTLQAFIQHSSLGSGCL